MAAGVNAVVPYDQYSESCLKLWEEGSLLPKLKAYDDGYGNPTIAWGCTEGVYFGMTVTPAQAEAMYQKEIAKFIAAVDRRVTTLLTTNQKGALVSFLYNLGTEAAPSLIAAINAQNWDAVPGIWRQYNKARKRAGGPLKVSAGLVTRRANELKLWNGTYTDRRIDAAGIPTSAKKPVTQVVKESPHVRGVLATAVTAIAGGFYHGLAYIVHGIQHVTDLAPQISSNVDQFMGPASKVAKSVGMPWDNIAYAVAGVLVVTTLIGLIVDGRKT